MSCSVLFPSTESVLGLAYSGAVTPLVLARVYTSVGMFLTVNEEVLNTVI